MSVSKNLIFFGLSAILSAQDSTLIDLPQKIGPIIDALPVLDSLIIVKKDTIDQKNSYVQFINPSTRQQKSYPINASGTFFRGIEMSSRGAGGLSGGLRFQMAGKLSETIRVSGTVTDESIPIQPEGTTAALDELDKVYLNVSHPSGELTAGDLTVNNNSGKYNNNNRNIVGIKNNINRNYTKFRTIIGQSKGKYHRLEIKGSDGLQGPYLLTSKEGLRNVIISAASESVWLNGEKLARGEDRDYTIDYSSGELIFTPKHLIYFDSDIDIEYQYSESTFKSNYVEAGMDGSIGNRFKYNITYIDERDNTRGSFLSGEQRSAFKLNDVIYQPGVVQDSLGDYVFRNDIFVFIFGSITIPVFSLKDRYTVTFSPDPAGDYVRKISSEHRIYYEFVATDQIDNRDRYSPGRSLKAPESNQLMQFNSNIELKEGTEFSVEGAFSVHDQNQFSQSKDSELKGNAYRLLFNQKPVKRGRTQIEYQFEHWQNSSRFQSLSRDRSVNFNEEWDLRGSGIEKESLSSISSKIGIGNVFTSQIGISQFNRGNHKKDRLILDLEYNGDILNQINLAMNQVQSDSVFRMFNTQVKLLDGPFQPFVNYSHELKENSYRFDDSVIGLTYSKKSKEFSIGISQRDDQQVSKENLGQMKKVLTGQFTQIDFKSRKRSGWRQEWMFRQRIQKNGEGRKQNDFNSMRTALNYRDRKSPFQLDFVLNSQASMSEARAVVYDSIGIGLGHYRFDEQLNEYVSDANGAYVAHTVFTGDRQHGTQLNGMTRFSIDFSKWKIDELKNWEYRLLNRIDFQGPKFTRNLSLTEENVQWYRQNKRHELVYRKKGQKNRHRIWWQDRINFNGLDPRGWEQRIESELGFSSLMDLNNDFQLVFGGDINQADISANSFFFRKERSLNGFNSEIGLKESIRGNIQWETRLVYYYNRILSFTGKSSKNVNAYGVKLNWTKFIGKEGRLEGNVEYYLAKGFSELPPEALKGLAYGRTLRGNVRASMFLGQSLSVNGTLLYLDDDRYDGFIKLQGEVRAHF